MPARRLSAALCLLLGPAAWPQAKTSLPRGGDLGRVWTGEDWNGASSVLKGRWVRQGDSARFHVFYSDAKGRPGTWSVEILSIEGDAVRMKVHVPLATGVKTYPAQGVIQADGRTIRGKAGWCAPGAACGFRVTADWKIQPKGVAEIALHPRSGSVVPAPPPARGGIHASPGAVWRVKDFTTPGFAWEGTWTFRGEVIQFSYQNKSTGRTTQGTLELQRWDGSYVRILNRGSEQTYEGYVQADGKTIKGTSTACGESKACGWEAVIEK